MSSAACPICRRPVQQEFRPFCSRRCANVDLQRWLVGAYAIPADDEEESGASGASHEEDED